MEDIFSTIEFQMSLLLFVSLAGYLIASRINQSAVIGEILVGLVIGPSLLGWITYTDFVQSVAHLGAVILLFTIGLEFRPQDIYNWRYGVIALVGVIIPWLGGFLFAQLFGYSSNTAIFVGTAMTATSVAITANVLKEMNKLDTPAAKAIIGAAVIDDILSLLLLSFSQQFVHGSVSFLAIFFLVLKAVAFLVAGALIGSSVISRWIARLDSTRLAKQYPELAFIAAMMVAFAYSMASKAIGISAIVGAFVAGVSLREINLQHSLSYKKGAEYLRIIFAALFFVSLGILADVKVIDLKIALFSLALIGIGVLTKVVGCAIPAKLLGLSGKDSLIVGFGMSPRGEVAMIIALIGLTEGIIGQDIYVSLVLVSLLTTIITPLVLTNWLYRSRRVSLSSAGEKNK